VNLDRVPPDPTVSAPRSIYYAPDESLRLDLSQAEIAEALKDDQGLLWLSLASDDPTSAALLRDLFGFHELAIEDCLSSHVDTPKVDDYGNYLLIVSQSVHYTENAERLELEEVDLFLGRNFVVTVKAPQSGRSVDKLFLEAQGNSFLLKRGADFIAHTILDVMVDDILPAVEAMDETLDDLEQRIIERPTKALLSEVLLLKRNTLRLRRSILPQRDMVNRLSRGEFGLLIRTEALIFYRDIYDHIVRVESMLDGLRDLADSSLSSYLSSLNNRMNEVMKAMSVVAVIFLPLTLIASIFGTNLDYSPTGLTLDGGFFWMLGLMIILTAAMILYFRRRGWF
jgi:magnesium transporter